MAEFGWNSRKTNRILFESQAAFRLSRTSKKEVRLNTETVVAKLVDISLGGCALESGSFVPVGAKLYVFLDRNLLQASGAKARKRHFSKITGVVRNSRQLSSRVYRLGIQFEKTSSEDQKLIKAFIESHDRREDKRVSL